MQESRSFVHAALKNQGKEHLNAGMFVMEIMVHFFNDESSPEGEFCKVYFFRI